MILDAEYIALKNNVIKVSQLHSFLSSSFFDIDVLLTHTQILIVYCKSESNHVSYTCYSVVDPDSALVLMRIRIQGFNKQKS
jgi:hypothetical protein